MNHTLKLFNTWQVTLPKSWRDKFNTKVFLAEETDNWLLIKPITDDNTIYYENSDWFGIYSEKWINPDKIISRIKKLQNG